jgi:hypothetical protein
VHFGLLFPRQNLHIIFGIKMDWATFRATVSQAHPVTMLSTDARKPIDLFYEHVSTPRMYVVKRTKIGFEKKWQFWICDRRRRRTYVCT